MSIDTIASEPRSSSSVAATEPGRGRRSEPGWRRLLKPLASLKLTVALFAMAIFVVFAGTLAQVDKDVWDVVHGIFRTRFAWIDLKIFFPPSFFPGMRVPESFTIGNLRVPLGFYFPGAWTIGGAMAVNLIAAHGLRFKTQASGSRLGIGLIVIALGVLATWLVIASGSTGDGMQAGGFLGWAAIWRWTKVAFVLLWLATCYLVFQSIKSPAASRLQRWSLAMLGAVLGGLVVWVLFGGDAAQLGNSSMRILWLLIKATAAALVLVAGCGLVFRKRAGIVLLHAGVGLMMFSEILVGNYAVEGQLVMEEGQTVNFARDIRAVELAVTDRSDSKYDDVVVVPRSFLLKSHDGKQPIRNADLPFEVQTLAYYKNSDLRDVKPGDKNLADAGAGQTLIAEELRPGSGTDPDAAVDVAAAYVRLSKKDGSPLGTYLMGLSLKPQTVSVDGKPYDVVLRFKQMYKDYTMRLIDVRKDDYVGTDTPRNYSSDVQLVDAKHNVDRKIHIWMNNPLRHAGETFYQQNYSRDPSTGRETTTLQVVSNQGWMIPYVSCMIVLVGMATQFLIVLTRFLSRRAAETGLVQVDIAPELPQGSKGRKVHAARRARETTAANDATRTVGLWLSIAVVACFGLYILSKAFPPSYPADAMDVYEFGKIPIAYQGRVKPIDTLARNSLQIVSGRQEFADESGAKQPAIRWLLDVVAKPEVARKHKVFRIENDGVLDTLGLKPRSGLKYSVAEFQDKIGEFDKQAELARKTEPEQMSTYQRKVLELDKKIRVYTLLSESFRQPMFPPLPDPKAFEQNREKVIEQFQAFADGVRRERSRQELLAKFQPPLAVPVTIKDQADPHAGVSEMQGWMTSRDDWETFASAWTADFIRQRLFNKEPNPATLALQDILVAYAGNDAKTFNRQVTEYQHMLKGEARADLRPAKTSFESYFNNFSPFYYAAILYLFAFILVALSWLVWTGPLSRASFWLIVFTFALHTLALVARIYISGRPPVTNLYSSAVFIGWGAVVLGMIFEMIYGLGIGNVISAVAGFMTLLIAHMLSLDGDTFIVLQAVLDTQFWLATHVVCITLGYATTYVAGLLGVFYILRGVLTRSLSPQVGRDLTRMIYGTLCFAILFSFVGTVLGGLWADDSWGRFWGWDPKENGALIIVLWNALVLHARWDGMVKERGLALLAVAGNIAVSWSWFGVNELGIGLHSYGFTDGVLLALGLFALSQLAIIGAGLLPREKWSSRREPVA